MVLYPCSDDNRQLDYKRRITYNHTYLEILIQISVQDDF